MQRNCNDWNIGLYKIVDSMLYSVMTKIIANKYFVSYCQSWGRYF